MGHWEKERPQEKLEDHRLLFECFLSEQMSLAQLYEHMQRNPEFRDYLLLEASVRDLKLGEV